MIDCDWAYAAGIIDGEGSISIHRKQKSFVLAVQVGVTDLILVDWMWITFGGNINHYQPPGDRKEVFIWKLHGTKAQEFIRGIMPYLKLKIEKAELALTFRVGGGYDEHEELYNQYCSMRSTKANHLRGLHR